MTIRDVAKSSGVSISTVSRVLNGHPDVSEAVREKVMKAVEELHYVPNDSARSLVQAQTDTIGVVIRGIGNPFFASIMAEIEKAAAKAGYEIARTQIGAEEDELLAGASLVKSRRLKGLILLGGRFDYSAEDAQRIDVPFVCCTFTNSFGDLATEQYSSISINDYAEAYRATQYLTARGHQRIGIVLERREDHSISELRYEGYKAALRDHGIAFDEALLAECDGRFTMPEAYEGMAKLLERETDFTAVFVLSDTTAIAAIKAMEDRGRRVPEDLSVIAIDGLEISSYTVPTLSTMTQPAEEMGRESVKLLLEVMDGGPHRHIRLEPAFRAGASLRTL